MPSKRDMLYGKLDEDTQKAIDKFIYAYTDVLQQGETATVKMFEETQQKALEEFEAYPELKAAYDKYTTWRNENKRTPLSEDDTELVLGYVLVNDINIVNREFRPSEEDKKFAVNAYSTWILDNDFVPSDKILAHFSRIDEAVFEEGREELAETGYRFEKVENGYQVVEKPDPRMIQLLELVPDESRDKLLDILSAMLAK